MFGLVILFCIPLFLMMAVSYKSACRHKKRAEAYRKQIEELQIERAGLKKSVQHYMSFDYRKHKPDMADAFLMAMAGAEVESKYGVDRSKNPPLSD